MPSASAVVVVVTALLLESGHDDSNKKQLYRGLTTSTSTLLCWVVRACFSFITTTTRTTATAVVLSFVLPRLLLLLLWVLFPRIAYSAFYFATPFCITSIVMICSSSFSFSEAAAVLVAHLSAESPLSRAHDFFRRRGLDRAVHTTSHRRLLWTRLEHAIMISMMTLARTTSRPNPHSGLVDIT
jgi:hypothetical protein